MGAMNRQIRLVDCSLLYIYAKKTLHVGVCNHIYNRKKVDFVFEIY